MSITLDTMLIKKMEFIDKLREKFSTEDNRKLKLPQIIVVGDQSSGKSSILEAISDIKLPKGVNTVTRCPIIIQMKQGEKRETRIMYVDAKKDKIEKKDITNTEDEIRKVQKDVFGDNLTKEPITIVTESPDLNTLTIIDLPGIIKTETTDHVTAAKEKTVEIAKFYMEQENSLIICVLPANQDICTTTTIGLAEKCNKDKSRIIVALTKLDKLDEKEATLIPDILSNKKLPVEKGFYGLIVSDEILKASFGERSQLEEEKLKMKPYYENYHERLGLKNFVTVLSRELECLIDKTLPDVRKNIRNLIEEKEKELGTFSKYNNNKDLQFSYIIGCQKEIDHKIEVMLTKADEEITKFPCMEKFLKDNDLLNPVQKRDTFLYFWHQTFKALFDEFNGIYKELFKRKHSPYAKPEILEEMIKRSRTENSSLFISSKISKSIVDEILVEFHDKTSKCLVTCYQFIEYMIGTVLVMDIETELHLMKTDIQKYGKEVLEKQLKETTEQINYLFDSEKYYFSQEDIMDTDGDDSNKTKTGAQATPVSTPVPVPKFGGNTFPTLVPNVAGVLNPEQPKIPSNPLNEKSDKEENSKFKNGLRLQKYLEKYITNLIGRLGDVIPNFIRLSLFDRFQKNFSKELLIRVLHPGAFPLYFNISEEKKAACCNLKSNVDDLKQFEKELDELQSNQNAYH